MDWMRQIVSTQQLAWNQSGHRSALPIILGLDRSWCPDQFWLAFLNNLCWWWTNIFQTVYIICQEYPTTKVTICMSLIDGGMSASIIGRHIMNDRVCNHYQTNSFRWAYVGILPLIILIVGWIDNWPGRNIAFWGNRHFILAQRGSHSSHPFPCHDGCKNIQQNTLNTSQPKVVPGKTNSTKNMSQVISGIPWVFHGYAIGYAMGPQGTPVEVIPGDSLWAWNFWRQFVSTTATVSWERRGFTAFHLRSGSAVKSNTYSTTWQLYLDELWLASLLKWNVYASTINGSSPTPRHGLMFIGSYLNPENCHG